MWEILIFMWLIHSKTYLLVLFYSLNLFQHKCFFSFHLFATQIYGNLCTLLYTFLSLNIWIILIFEYCILFLTCIPFENATHFDKTLFIRKSFLAFPSPVWRWYLYSVFSKNLEFNSMMWRILKKIKIPTNLSKTLVWTFPPTPLAKSKFIHQ